MITKLKFILTFSVFLMALFTGPANADIKVLDKTKDLKVLGIFDELEDRKSCGIAIGKPRRGHPRMAIFVKHDVSGKHVVLNANGGIGGVGIKYKTDKLDKAKLFGYEYDFQTDRDNYIIKGSEYEELVNDLKAGNTLVYKISSSNQFVESGQGKVSLSGFTKLYKLAEKCSF